MDWIRRVVLWMLSVVMADLVVIWAWMIALAVFSGLSPNQESVSLSNFVGGLIFLPLLSLWLVVPGWLLGLPVVISVQRVGGWRSWVLGAYVTALGPAVALLFWGDRIGFNTVSRDDLSIGGVGLAVSLLSAAFYLAVLRRLSRDSIEQAQP